MLGWGMHLLEGFDTESWRSVYILRSQGQCGQLVTLKTVTLPTLPD